MTHAEKNISGIQGAQNKFKSEIHNRNRCRFDSGNDCVNELYNQKRQEPCRELHPEFLSPW